MLLFARESDLSCFGGQRLPCLALVASQRAASEICAGMDIAHLLMYGLKQDHHRNLGCCSTSHVLSHSCYGLK